MGITTFNRWRRMEAERKAKEKTEVKIEREVTETKVEKAETKPAEKTEVKTERKPRTARQ